ncbi:MAG: 6-bladed beta-propeller [Oscillospiraceae bacterium]|jgi:hypothetical protein|nr:6-bladed beta-propeller [Oscillospiraceae bacterium]
MKINFFSFFFFLFIICSCKNDKWLKHEDTGGLRTITIPSLLNANDVDIIDDLDYIILEEKENSYYGHSSKVRVFRNRIYIADLMFAQSLFIYSKEGKHISTIGTNKGRGPLEFLSLTNFEIDYENNQLLVLDNRGSKFMVYDLDGKFIKRIDSEIPVTTAALLPNGYIIHAKSSFEYKVSGQSNSCIFITDDNKKVIKEGFEYDDNKNLAIRNSNWFNSRLDGGISFAPKFRDTIYRTYFDSIVPKYAIDYGRNKALSQKQIQKLTSSSELNELTKAGNLCFFGNHVENDGHLYLKLESQNPVFVFYNKKTSNTVAFNQKVIIGDPWREMYSLLCSDEEGYFYGAFNLTKLDQIIELFPELEKIDKSRDLNPILFRYKVKI